MTRPLLAACCLAAVLAPGCGPGEPPLYPVEGTVKFTDGAPAAGCTVEFRSEAEPTKRLNARAEVGADGRYTLKTVLNGKEKDGAVAGPHKVIVVGPPATSSGGPTLTVPTKYIDYGSSGLAYEVKPGPDNRYPITLERR